MEEPLCPCRGSGMGLSGGACWAGTWLIAHATLQSRRDWSPQTRPIMVRKEHPCTGPSGDAEDGSCLPPRQGMGPAGKAALLPVPFPAHGSSSSRLHPSLLTVSWKQCASPTPQPSPSVYSPGKAEDLLRAWRAPAGLRLI
ncbi:uncharacterized protein LOC106994708 isoform X4 [Macaca mulatta]